MTIMTFSQYEVWINFIIALHSFFTSNKLNQRFGLTKVYFIILSSSLGFATRIQRTHWFIPDDFLVCMVFLVSNVISSIICLVNLSLDDIRVTGMTAIGGWSMAHGDIYGISINYEATILWCRKCLRKGF